VSVLESFVKWLECRRRGRCVFGLDAKCVHCGTDAAAPTVLEVLRGAVRPKKES